MQENCFTRQYEDSIHKIYKPTIINKTKEWLNKVQLKIVNSNFLFDTYNQSSLTLLYLIKTS